MREARVCASRRCHTVEALDDEDIVAQHPRYDIYSRNRISNIPISCYTLQLQRTRTGEPTMTAGGKERSSPDRAETFLSLCEEADGLSFGRIPEHRSV